MKILMLNGSPRPQGNTARALDEMAEIFRAEGIDAEIVQVGNREIRGCVGCLGCKRTGKCAFPDLVNEVACKFKESDGLVIASPVYYAQANGTLTSFVQRLFYSTNFDKRMKVGASVVVARRSGLSSTYDELNKFFGISGMPIAGGQYWNSVHGQQPGEVEQDAEGMQGLRTLARNMSFLVKSIALGKEQFGLPEREPTTFTNFVR